MKCSEIINLIETDYPPEKAEDWDNPGLLAGRADREVRKLLVALDATEEIVDFAVEQKCQMLFTHHPMIFGSVKKINDSDFLGRKLLKLIENGISYYAAHTNYDVCRMADLNGQQLGLKDAEVLLAVNDDGEPEGIGRVGMLEAPMKLSELAELVKRNMDVQNVSVFGSDDPVVTRVAVSGGSGRSVVDTALQKGAEVLITGDISHHTGLDALENGLHIIDAGHYGTEHCFIKDAAERLRSLCPEVEVIEADQKPPFRIL